MNAEFANDWDGFWINGEEAAAGTVQRTVPLIFTASETFDVGMDTASPVADDYFDQAPFAFEGTLKRLRNPHRRRDGCPRRTGCTRDPLPGLGLRTWSHEIE
ncbi:MAG: hypothetical protein C1943_12295 [Halochromatium sp.]|nr:hypothetical protein [Halochromatium sp.]